MKKIFYPIAFAASTFPMVSGCASVRAADGQFTKITSADIERSLFNQVHGQVTSRIRPQSSMELDGSCLFRYKEEFLDGNGKIIGDMNVNTSTAFLISRYTDGCKEPISPFTKVFDLDVARFRVIKPMIDAFLKGEYEGANSSLDALLRAGVVPTSISRKSTFSFSFVFTSPSGYGEAVVNLEGANNRLVLESFSGWQ